MIKETPSLGRILAMVAFALSCFAILLYLWLSFGGSVPLRAESYRFQVAIPEAVTLADEADVRISGVDVGKVKSKQLDDSGTRTLIEIELESRYAPITRDSRAVLRTKTLIGETYVEIAPGSRSAPALPDGARLPDSRVAPSVELDEIAALFDARTRRAFGDGAVGLARALASGRSRDLNAALGNLAGFADGGERLFGVLEREELSLRRLVKNGGITFASLSERRGALRELIVSSEEAFGALASRDEALADTIAIMPTFLDEARATATRVERSLLRAAPLVRDLGPAADDLGPTLRDVAAFSPDLRATFRDLDPLIAAGRSGLPALERTVRAAGPVVESIPPFAAELNPVASMLNFFQGRVANFIANGGAGIGYNIGGDLAVANSAVFHPDIFRQVVERPDYDRGNAYPQPAFPERRTALGNFESFDCSKAVGPGNRFGDVKQNDAIGTGVGPLDELVPPDLLPTDLIPGGRGFAKRPPCFVRGPSLYDGRLFNTTPRGRAPVKAPPDPFSREGLPITGRP